MMMVVIKSDYVMYLSELNMCSDWFFPILRAYHFLQTKTNKTAVLWQRNHTMPL